ncbi:hypothetical protein MtrunA17_Chr7g0226251 [Medicago truncatula]|uniref:Uncharacterized protein n=1 Tax=Medicago truncatula TaxID=3880 RepID=A0A396GX82_MEDTR|nr:hypothetical protein MtrunA17_Chr7g0226251 [Medicago truncatula]
MHLVRHIYACSSKSLQGRHLYLDHQRSLQGRSPQSRSLMDLCKAEAHKLDH